MVYMSYHEFVTTPLTTSLETDNYKTTKLNFPGMEIKLVSRTCMYASNIFIKIYLDFDNSIKQFIFIYLFCSYDKLL